MNDLEPVFNYEHEGKWINAYFDGTSIFSYRAHLRDIGFEEEQVEDATTKYLQFIERHARKQR